MSSQKANSVLVFVAVLVAAIIVIYAIVSRKPATVTGPEDGATPTSATNEDEGTARLNDSASPEDDGVTEIDQTTDTTTGEVPGGNGTDTGTDDDAEGQMPEPPATLLEAAQRGDTGALAAMVDAGADLNGTDDGGRTPLMHAAAGGHLEAVFTLLNGGADPALRDNARRAARDYALARADEPGQTIARILEDAVGPPPVIDAAEK